MKWMNNVNNIGRILCRLISISLGLNANYFDEYIYDPWTHMRVLHFPPKPNEQTIGIHAHTDYGFLVIASQDQVGGLYVRPPIHNEYRPTNIYNNEGDTSNVDYVDKKWIYVEPPMDRNENVLHVFPGDFMQYITNAEYKATPHKVMTSHKDRYALAAFFEPNFDSYHYPIYGKLFDQDIEPVHYGTHFTKMFMRCYPNSETTQNIVNNNLLERAQISKISKTD